jgi:thioredoxin reductase (NADPH)
MNCLEGNEKVQQAVIFDNRSKEEITLDVDTVILALGFKADLGPIREWGLETIGRRYIKVDSRMETKLIAGWRPIYQGYSLLAMLHYRKIWTH